jgi:hypothetical protein
MAGGDIDSKLFCICCEKEVNYSDRQKHNKLKSHIKKKEQLIKEGNGMMRY